MSTNITPSEPVSRMTPEHWARLHAMTEEQIVQNALADPDNPPLDDHAIGKGATETIHITVDASYMRWLHDHHLDGGKVAAALLAQFVAAQSGEKNA